MKTKIAYVVILTSFLLFSIFNLNLPAFAIDSQFEVIIKVSEKGFFDANQKPLNNLLKVPEDSEVKLIFEYIGIPGDKHEFALLFESGEERYSDPITHENKRAHISFYSGKTGDMYDVFCMIDCDAMDFLTDLVIEVV